MKKNILLLVFFIGTHSAHAGALIETRINDGLQALMTNPWPYPDANWKARYSGLLLHLEQQQPLANQLIDEWCASYELDKDVAPTAYHDPRPDATLYTLYMKSHYADQLTAQNKDNIEDALWRWVYQHSFIDPAQTWPLNNPTKSVWIISGSENHDAAQRSANLLALQVLRQAGAPYGPDATLYDGYTVEQHYQAWVDWYKAFFRQRGREGLNCEIAHPSSYGQSTMGHYYDIYDLTEDVELKFLTESYLNLFWAHVASEFEPSTGIRGSIAASRNYKWSWIQNGDLYWARSLLYAYDWCDLANAPTLVDLHFYLSDYRPPEIIRQIANDPSRGAYMSTSRRFGLGSGWDAGIYDVLFEDGAANNSYMRRDTYYTPDYTMSTLSFDSGRSYIELTRQSRTMGVTFANDVNDRIVVYGGIFPVDIATEYKGTTSSATNGMLGENCMIVARDINVTTGNSHRVFISDGDLWNNRIENDGGWFFTSAGGGYCGFRSASAAGYVIDASPYNNGYILTFNDLWAPVIVQMGRAADYPNFAAFKTAVKANGFSYVADKLTYTSENGDTYEYWANSATVGKINGTTIDLNPAKAYDSPYLSMDHGADVATVSYPGADDLIINFTAVCGTFGYFPEDFNYDCIVDGSDLTVMTTDWLDDQSNPVSGSDDYPQLVAEGWALPGNYNIPKTTIVPTVDGVVATGEWMDARRIEMVYPAINSLPNTGSLYGGTTPPDNNGDFSLYWFLKWDTNNLYLLGVVYDDIIDPLDQPGLCLNPLNQQPAAFPGDLVIWELATTGTINALLPVAPSASQLMGSVQGDHYVVEMQMPWSDFNAPGYVPTVGHEHGFGLLCQDYDAGSVREHYFLDIGSGIANITDASTWNTITLVDTMPPGEGGVSRFDLNSDYSVDLIDFSQLWANWMACNDPEILNCLVVPSGLMDDVDTVGLWHFDSSYTNIDVYYGDDDSANLGRDNDLIEYSTGAPFVSLVAGGFDGEGFAAQFDVSATDTYLLTSMDKWPVDGDTFRYQGWVKLAAGNGGYLVHVYDQVWLHCSASAGTITFQVDPDTGNGSDTVSVTADIITTGQWQYIEAIYDGTEIRLITDAETVTAAGTGVIVPDNRNIYVGSRKNKSRFVGLMDEVKLSTP